jgi:hypothetical protein
MGAFLLAAMGERFRRPEVAFVGAIIVGGAQVLLGITTSFAVAGWLLLVEGLALALCAILTNTILQTTAPNGVRAQVVALYSFIVIGIAPFGSELVGQLGEHLGPGRAILIGGFGILAASLIAAWRARGQSLAVEIQT